MLALPHGAADTGGIAWSPPVGDQRMAGQIRRQVRRHAQSAPCPGPPPPCGIANVLCRFRWQTSAPIGAGLVRPTCAFMLAPSMYTWPPCACTMAQMSRMSSSNTPCVDG